ncbi:unnamed protein product [Mesocestoides corti]|uniref:Uncharacterized protein n=3 Tax=Mesocestoides corti TaxID=53468 RepID=A0A0R3UAL4_MESCO|nr:unnamed protein product [Mesocestoides corti]
MLALVIEVFIIGAIHHSHIAQQELDLSSNKISALPDITGHSAEGLPPVLLEDLCVLDLSRNALTSVPPWLFGLSLSAVTFAPRLGTLRLCGNQLRSVPRHMWLAACLFCLDLSQNRLTKLPKLSVEEVAFAAKTRALGRPSVFPSSSKVVSAAREVSCLPQLLNGVKQVSMLTSGKDEIVRNSVGGASAQSPAPPHRDGVSRDGRVWTGGLVHLWVQRNRLCELPLETLCADVGLSQQAPNLASLDASGNQLTQFGSPSDYPPSLIYLDLANNKISAVGPSDVGSGEAENDAREQTAASVVTGGQLPNLLHLCLRNNCLTTFNPMTPQAAGGGDAPQHWFPELTSLDLSGNATLKSLGSVICCCEKLSSLELDGCASLSEVGAAVIVDALDDNGLSAYLVAAFYGHVDCVRQLLEFPDIAVTSSSSPDESVVADDVGDPFSDDPNGLACFVDAFRTLNLQWYFTKDGANSVVLNPKSHPSGDGHFICGKFNAFHLAIMTGNLDLANFICGYMEEEEYRGLGSDAGACVQCATLPVTESVDLKEPLARQSRMKLLANPVGLACCLDDVVTPTQWLATGMLRVLAFHGAKPPPNHALLHLLMDRQRFLLVGCVLSMCPRGTPNVVDWSNRAIFRHLPDEMLASEILGTLIADWLTWLVDARSAPSHHLTVCRPPPGSGVSLDSLTKINLSNNALMVVPLCLLTQLPRLQVSECGLLWNCRVKEPQHIPRRSGDCLTPYLGALTVPFKPSYLDAAKAACSNPFPPVLVQSLLVRCRTQLRS